MRDYTFTLSLMNKVCTALGLFDPFPLFAHADKDHKMHESWVL